MITTFFESFSSGVARVFCKPLTELGDDDRYSTAVRSERAVQGVLSGLVMTYVVMSSDATWFAWATLPAMSATNLGLGAYLLRADRDRSPSPSA